MKLQKHETRKDLVVLLLLVLIPITSLLYTKYPINTDGLNPILFGSMLIALTLLKIYFYYRTELQKGIVDYQGVRINIRNVISYSAIPEGIKVVTNDAQIIFKPVNHVGTITQEKIDEIANLCVNEFDVAYKYYKG